MFYTQNFATFAELKCEKILGTEFKIFDGWLQGSISNSADSVRKLPLHNYPDTCPQYLGSCILHLFMTWCMGWRQCSWHYTALVSSLQSRVTLHQIRGWRADPGSHRHRVFLTTHYRVCGAGGGGVRMPGPRSWSPWLRGRQSCHQLG